MSVSSVRAPAPDALVFDMDGLLLDTERIARDAFEEACREAGWADPALDVYARCIGGTGEDEGAILRAGYGPEFPWEAVRDGWRRRYHERVEHRAVPVKPGAAELLSYCFDSGLPCALATSTRAELAQTKLALAGLDAYFPVRVTGDMVRRGKPDPEPYLAAAARLGTRPERCWGVRGLGQRRAFRLRRRLRGLPGAGPRPAGAGTAAARAHRSWLSA